MFTESEQETEMFFELLTFYPIQTVFPSFMWTVKSFPGSHDSDLERRNRYSDDA